MKQWFQKIGAKLRIWLSGRYGQDELSRVLWFAALILILVSLIDVLRFLVFPAWVLLFWSMFRTFSRNISARRAERNAFMSFLYRIKSFFKRLGERWRNRKTHVYFRCPGCKKSLRVPRGKGKLRITCPGCGRVIEKKT